MSNPTHTLSKNQNIGIILGSLSCFILLWLQLFATLDIFLKTTVILPFGIFLTFALTGLGGWLYLCNTEPVNKTPLKIFLLIIAACAVIVPFLLQYTQTIMTLTALLPLVYLLFTKALKKTAKYLRPLKYFAVFVAAYALIIGVGLSYYLLSLEPGDFSTTAFMFSVVSSLVLLPVFGIAFLGTGLNAVRTATSEENTPDRT